MLELLKVRSDAPTAVAYREQDLAAEGAENADPFFADFVRDDIDDWLFDLACAAMRAHFIGTDDTKKALADACNIARDRYARAFHAYAGGHYRRLAKDELGL